MKLRLLRPLALAILLVGLIPSRCEDKPQEGQKEAKKDQPQKEQKPTEEKKSAEEQKPTEEKKSAEEQKPTEEQKPSEEKAPDDFSMFPMTPGFIPDFQVDADFRVPVHARTAECFYNNFVNGTNAYFNLEVTSGGDRLIDYHIKELHTQKWLVPLKKDVSNEFYEHKFDDKAVIEICLINFQSSIHHKIVYLSIYKTVLRPETSADKEHKETIETVSNFTVRFDNIIKSITNMTMTAKKSNSHIARDFGLMRSNQKYVQFWAIVNVVLILASSSLQVFFLRQLFREPVNRRTRV